MSINNYILNLLNIEDKSIFINKNNIQNKDFKKFKNIVYHPNKNLSSKMKQALKLYMEHIEFIENSFKYDMNNGIIEGTNNLIKTLKRIAFGYRKYKSLIIF